MKRYNKIEVSVFNIDIVLQREHYKNIDFKELDDLWLTHDEKYDEEYIFYLTIEEKPFENFPSLKWETTKRLAFNKIPTEILYPFTVRKLRKQDIRRISLNPLQEELLGQTKNIKRCRTMFGQRLHSEALQSGRKYYSMKKQTYEYLKGEIR